MEKDDKTIVEEYKEFLKFASEEYKEFLIKLAEQLKEFQESVIIKSAAVNKVMEEKSGKNPEEPEKNTIPMINGKEVSKI